MKIQKVLLIEDEEDIRTIVELSLGEVHSWGVIMATTGAEGLALAAAQRPDVILLDIMLSDYDGVSVFRALRERPATAAIPVIFMTARVQKHEVADYLALGAAGVIGKPFDPMRLQQEIVAHLERINPEVPRACEGGAP